MRRVTGVLGDRIWLERFAWAHDASAPNPAGDRQPVTLDIAPTRDLATTGLGFDTIDDSHFAALWISTEVVNPEPRYAICGYSGAVTEGPAVASTGWITKGACTFDNDRGEYRIVLSNDNPVTSVIWGTTLEYVQPPPTVLSGAGCSPTVLRWLGNRGIGSETERIAVVGAPAGSGHFVLVSLAAANQPILDPAVATGCSLLVSNGAAFLGTLDFQVGSTPSWSFALPEWLPPTTLYLQDWIFDGSRFAATQRLEVPVVR